MRTMPAERVTSLSPWHVVLVLDDSDAVRGQVAADMNTVVREILAEMEVASKGVKPYFLLSILVYGESTSTLEECHDARAIDQDRIASLSGADGQGRLVTALKEAKAVLARHPGKASDFRPYVFVFCGGRLADEPRELLKAARELKRLKLAAGAPKIAVIALGDSDTSTLGALASAPELCRHPSDLDGLLRMFPPIGTVAGLFRNGEEKIDDIIMNL